MNISMTLTMALIAAGCLTNGMLIGCSTNKLSQSNNQAFTLAGKSAVTDNLKNIINDDKVKDSVSMSKVRDDDVLQSLKAQLEQQQKQLETMSTDQQLLQEKLKRQQMTLNLKPLANANAGRAKLGTASIAHIAFLEAENQLTEVEELAAKEVNIIPNRETTFKLNIPQNAKFVAIKVGLRYTQKRSQFLIPLDSIDFDKPLVLNIGACDVNIKEGVKPELTPTFSTKLKYYQQPLASCL